MKPMKPAKRQKKQKKKPEKERILITAALPYANGPLHLGHILECVQADIYTRAMKLFGSHAVFVCADDTHGAPIEMKAASLGITPEQLIATYYGEHVKDFADFQIAFDSYCSTNSPENKKYSEFFFEKLNNAGAIYTKKISVIYCEHCKRFLPDRYVKGTCPSCRANEQYGDVCEKCNNTYKTTDLIQPHCAVCGKKPVQKTAEHYFFRLSAYAEKLREFFHHAELQEEILNSVKPWLNNLQDWCISRDGPYFGFKIPGEENKYFYVWLDAPIGYITSTVHYCETAEHKTGHKETVDEYWNNQKTRIIHFIGKDIVYFHFLFWPAMLMTAGFCLPAKIMVHGFLTVNKEKMSKSRGTFITARQYLDHLKPDYLRFYYAAHLSQTVADIDFDAAQLKEQVNSELIGNIANFCYRVLSFAVKYFDGNLNSFRQTQIAEEVAALRLCVEAIKKDYEQMNFKAALHGILAFSSLGNRYFQQQEPWKLIKENPEKVKEVLSFCTLLIKNISILLSPVLPAFCAAQQKQLGVSGLKWSDISFAPEHFALSDITPLVQKIEEEHNALLIHFPLLLKVGKILSVEEHPNAEKLYVEKITLCHNKDQDTGHDTCQDDDIHTIVSGIRQWYKKEELVGKHVIVVANLKPAKIRGVLSQGMILAAEHENNLKVIEAPKSKIGAIVYVDKNAVAPRQISYDEFEKVEMTVSNKHILCSGKELKTEHEKIVVDMPDGTIIK